MVAQFINLQKFSDYYFVRKVEMKNKKGEGEFFEGENEVLS